MPTPLDQFIKSSLTSGVNSLAYSLGSGSDINLSLASYYSKTITANTTFTYSNPPAPGVVSSFILEITNGGSFAITWWPGIKWPAGSIPTMTATGLDILSFYTRDGGSTWVGMLVAKDIK